MEEGQLVWHGTWAGLEQEQQLEKAKFGLDKPRLCGTSSVRQNCELNHTVSSGVWSTSGETETFGSLQSGDRGQAPVSERQAAAARSAKQSAQRLLVAARVRQAQVQV